jgi:hypothetical protein
MGGWHNRAWSPSRTSGSRLTIRGEPPSADPHAGWCGGRGRKSPAYPIGRTTGTLRYLHAASPRQRLLQFYPKNRTMARDVPLLASASLVPERSEAQAGSSCTTSALDGDEGPSCLAPERSGGGKQLTRLSFDGEPSSLIGLHLVR